MNAAAVRTMAEWYDTGPFKPFAKATRITSCAAPLTLIEVCQPAGDFSDPPLSEVMVAISRRATKGVVDVGEGGRPTRLRPGDVLACPADVRSVAIFDEPNAFLALMLPTTVIAPLVEQATGRATQTCSLLHRHPERDPTLQRLVEAIWHEAESDNPFGRLFVDGAVMSIVARLAASTCEAAQSASRPPGLDAATLRRVDAIVDASLADGAGIAELAAQCEMRDYEFTRAFKAATGMPPYQYVIERRLERAKQLLANTNDPLADIAYTVGFASQSHMTDVFRMKLGVTPGRYRKERRA
jgi:AraC family transcriptional regulator